MTLNQVFQRPRAAPHALDRLARTGRSQALTMSGQLVAGLGNLVITAILARVLLPGDYAAFVAFVAGYVLIHTVASSVTPAVALDPGLQQRLFTRALCAGVAAGGVLAVTSTVLAPLLGLPVMMVILLGVTAPCATMLALARGRLYGTQRIGGTVATLCTEPMIRGLLGFALVPALGAIGAAAAVVAASFAALGVAALTGRSASAEVRPTPQLAAGKSAAVTLTFLVIAVIAAQDVILANRLLPADQAGVIAAVATLGGAAYFATATVPMVLLPNARDGRRGSLLVALGAAVLVSMSAIVVVALIPASGYAAALGEPYRDVSLFAVRYVAAMAALGVAKVLLAHLCVAGRTPLTSALVIVAALTHLALLLFASSAAGIVNATLVASVLLLFGAGSAVLLTRSVGGSQARADTATTPPRSLWSRLLPLWPLFVAIAIGVTLRVIVTRSIWVDEAISVRQALLPYSEMIDTLRQNDVHPPLFATVLWAVVHLTGSTAEWVVRLPSLVAGTVFIPVIYAMATDLWDRRTGRIAAMVAAVAPIAVWYAQEARMYAIWMLLATLAAWAQLRILRAHADSTGGRGATKDWILFVICTVSLLYLQWFAVLPVLVQHAVFLGAALHRRSIKLAKTWLITVAASLALFAAVVPFLLVQGSSVIATASATPGQTGGAASAVGSNAPDIYALVANTIWALWGYHSDLTMVQLGALWPLALLTCFAALGRVRSGNGLVIALIAIVPAVALFALGFARSNFFELRYFTSTIPMLLLFVSRLAATWGRGPLTRLLLPVVVIASLGWGLADQQVNQSNPRTYDFRGAVNWVETRSQPDDLLLYAPQFLSSELDYYPAGIKAVPTSGFDPSAQSRADTSSDGRSIFVFASFLDQANVSAQVGKTLADLENSGSRQVARYEVANVTVWQFEEGER